VENVCSPLHAQSVPGKCAVHFRIGGTKCPDRRRLSAQTGAEAVNKDQALQQSDEKKADAAAGPTGAPGSVPGADAAKIHWTGTVTGGFQFSRGQTDADGVSITGDGEYTGPDRGYRFEGVVMFAKVRAPTTPGESQVFTAMDHRALFFTFFQKIKGPFFLVDRMQVEHDVLRDINLRAMNLSGIGIHMAYKDKLQVMLVPGVGFAYEDKPQIRDGTVFTPGIYQGASWHFSKYWMFEQWLQYRANPDNSHDYTIDGSAGITGMFSAKLGFNFSYIYSYEGLVGFYGGTVVPTVPYRVLSQVTVGLRFKM
jgi:hypothetical protein